MIAASASDIVLDQSDWREAPLRVDQSIFAIGDVHGCHRQLALLLDTFEALATDVAARLLMLSIGADENLAQAAYNKWMAIDGATFVDELRRASGRHEAALTRELLGEAAGPNVLGQLETLEHSVRVGNTIFVHGGIDPSVEPSIALAAPFTAFG